MIEKLGSYLNWQTNSLSEFQPLREHDLHVWHLDLSLEAHQIETAMSLLSDIQLDKYHRRSTSDLKHQYIAGRYYLMTLLGAYTNQAPEEVLLSYSRLNKPSLSNEDLDIEFNFTDTDGQGMFAFSRSRQVGVDIERLDREINFEAIAERRFTEQELAFVKPQTQLDLKRCLAIWTRKEAFGKATGQGINFKMNQRNLYDAGEDGHICKFTDDAEQAWTCQQISIGQDYIASVTHEGHEPLEISAFNRLI